MNKNNKWFLFLKFKCESRSATRTVETHAEFLCRAILPVKQGGTFRLYPINIMRFVFDLKVKQKILQ